VGGHRFVKVFTVVSNIPFSLYSESVASLSQAFSKRLGGNWHKLFFKVHHVTLPSWLGG
jgi:hypothetical protein